MNEKTVFRKELLQIAVPVTLQCILQASFSVIDQIMTGQLGSANIAGIGIGSKFASVFSVIITAVAAVAGIMIAQYIGKKDTKGTGRSLFTNLFVSLMVVFIFTFLSMFFPKQITGMYTTDSTTMVIGGEYLKIYALSFLPMAITSILSAYLRCVNSAKIPLYAGICACVINTGLNYLLIFGKAGFPKMGAVGAAWASVFAQIAGCIITILFFIKLKKRNNWQIPFNFSLSKANIKQYLVILAPLLICEFFWVFGENVYASVYGHIGTNAMAAMTLTNPVQSLVMGALSGISQAAGVMIGKKLGANEKEKAYINSKKFFIVGLVGSLILSLLVVILCRYYVMIFNVENEVMEISIQLFWVYALVAPIKALNMIIGGGILRSGGKTTYIMIIDIIGTWIFGVPLSLLTAFVFHMPIWQVYLILSMEECIRLIASLIVFKRKNWMQTLK